MAFLKFKSTAKTNDILRLSGKLIIRFPALALGSDDISQLSDTVSKKAYQIVLVFS